MDKKIKQKKILFFVLFLFLAIRIVYIVVGEEVNDSYYVSTSIDVSSAKEVPCVNIVQKFVGKRDKLNSLEIILSNITDDNIGTIQLKILKKKELLYQTNILLSNINNNEWKKIYVNLPLQKEEEYTIMMNALEDCTQIPNVFLGEGSEEVVGYTMKAVKNKAAIQYGYLQKPGRLDKAVSLSLLVLFLFIFVLLWRNFKQSQRYVREFLQYICPVERKEAFRILSEVFLCTIIINSSGIEFQEPTKVIFYAISLLSTFGYEKRKEYVNKLLDKSWKRIFMYVLYIYSSFALVGQRIFIYPLSMHVTLVGFFVFCSALGWFIPVLVSGVYLFVKLEPCLISESKGNSNTVHFKFILLLISFLILPAAYNLFANNPGISSPDTLECMIVNAKHLYGMVDWHPAFYCMILRVIQKIWDSTYAVIFVQYTFWVYVMMEFLLYLQKKGMRKEIILCISFLSGMNASNFMHLNTIWKDVPYTLSILWAFILLAKFTIDFNKYRGRKRIYFELSAALIGIFFFRKNGIVPFIVIVIILLIVLRKNIKIWATIILTIMLIIFIKFPLYSYYAIENTGRTGMYIGLSQDILGVYYAGGDVSEQTLQMINMMTDYNNAEYVYTPTWSYQSYNLDVEPIKFIASYMDTFVRNPVVMIQAIIAREDAIWNIFAGQDAVLGCVNYHLSEDDLEGGGYKWNDYYPKRTFRKLYTYMSKFTGYTASSQWISALEWRCGVFTLVGLISIVILLIRTGAKNLEYMLLISPVIGHILGLLLSTGWADFRYFWPLNLMNMCLIPIVFVLIREKENNVSRDI